MSGNVPLTEACSGEAGACLFGTARAVGFSSSPALTVNLYRVFPSGAVNLVQQQLVASQLVAVDGTWAFSGEEAWGHYYVQLVAAVQPNASAAPKQASTVIGPLSVPSGQPQALQVGPLFAVVLQSNGGGGAQEVNEVTVQVYDPVTGDVVSDAAVSVTVGDASLPLAWDPESDIPSYRATFDAGIPAQPGYTVWSSSWDGAAELVAPDPAPVGAITSPAVGAVVVDDGGTFGIDWTPEPLADFEVVEVFARSDAGYSPVYVSPTVVPPGVDNTGPLSSAGVELDAGAYVVNVAYVRAKCTVTGGGCVQAGSIATENFAVAP
jgi:hypothetical protein